MGSIVHRFAAHVNVNIVALYASSSNTPASCRSMMRLTTSLQPSSFVKPVSLKHTQSSRCIDGLGGALLIGRFWLTLGGQRLGDRNRVLNRNRVIQRTRVRGTQ